MEKEELNTPAVKKSRFFQAVIIVFVIISLILILSQMISNLSSGKSDKAVSGKLYEHKETAAAVYSENLKLSMENSPPSSP